MAQSYRTGGGLGGTAVSDAAVVDGKDEDRDGADRGELVDHLYRDKSDSALRFAEVVAEIRACGTSALSTMDETATHSGSSSGRIVGDFFPGVIAVCRGK